MLEHYLRSEQGLDIDTDALEEMAYAGNGFDPYPVYAALTRLCAQVPDFAVTPRLVVGTFSYAKLPMVADLAAQGSELADHDVVAALAGDPGALRAVRSTVPDSPADADPSREHLILDADSTQQSAIDAVRSGAHLVIKGPPGTGKSQTIANLIASPGRRGQARALRRREAGGHRRGALAARAGRPGRPRPRRLRRRQQQAAPRPGVRCGARARRRGGRARHRRRRARPRRAPRPGWSSTPRRCTEVREPWGVSAHQMQDAISTLSARRTAADLAGPRARRAARRPQPAADRRAGAPADRGRLAGRLVDRRRQRPLVCRADRHPGRRRARPGRHRPPQPGRAGRGPEDDRRGVRRGHAAHRSAGLRTGARCWRPWRGCATPSRCSGPRSSTSRSASSSPPPAASSTARRAASRWAGTPAGGCGGRPAACCVPAPRPPTCTPRSSTPSASGSRGTRWPARAAAPRSRSTSTGPARHTTLSPPTSSGWGSGWRPPVVAGTCSPPTCPSCRSGWPRWPPAPSGSPSCRGCSARWTRCARPAWARSWTTWPAAASTSTTWPPRSSSSGGPRWPSTSPCTTRPTAPTTATTCAGSRVSTSPPTTRTSRATAERVRAAAGRRLREVLADHPDEESIVRAEAGKARRHRPLRDMLPRAGEHPHRDQARAGR